MKLKILYISTVLSFSLQCFALDPFSGYQWGLRNQGLPQVIDLDPLITYRIAARVGEDIHKPPLKLTNRKILVAVLDTGINKSHPELKNIIHKNESECRALEKYNSCLEKQDQKTCEKIWFDLNNPEVDQDKNGYPMDCQGWSVLGGVNAANIMGRPDFDDDQGHGTHVSGIIAAEANNNLGVMGTSSNVEILPVQVLGKQPNEPLKPLSFTKDTDLSPSEENKKSLKRILSNYVARGVLYAIRSGAQVINFSMGWPQTEDSDYMRSLIKEAQSRGIIIVAAAGNDSTGALLLPCAYSGVICVAAHGPDGSLAYFSNFGTGVDIAAPGVNILSTYPMDKRPIRFRSTLGYEFLSGTSQATPFVTGVVAEMLAQGIPSQEIYPRLVLGARPIQDKLPLLAGSSHLNPHEFSPQDPYQKIILSGNLDMTQAMQVQKQPLIVPFTKEKQVITWDRQSPTMKFQFTLKNYWQEIDSSKVLMSLIPVKLSPLAIRPRVISVEPIQNYNTAWVSQEERTYEVELGIEDQSNPSLSRIPSELDFELQLKLDGYEQPGLAKKFILNTEVIVPLNENTTGSDIEVIPLQNMPKGRLSFSPIDQNLDGKTQRDYFTIVESKKDWQISLMTRNMILIGQPYQSVGSVKVQFDTDAQNMRDMVLARMDINGDGKSEYVLGLLEDQSMSDEDKPSPITFYVFDGRMNLLESFKYDSEIAQIPYEIYWQKVGQKKRPAWVGYGKKPNKKRGLRDRWENPDNHETQATRFYYLDQDNKLQALEEYQDYKIVDVIEPTKDQVLAGVVPVLLAKNKGTKSKPSYIYDFAIAEVSEGKVQNLRTLDFFALNNYRNLLDTRVEKTLSLDNDGNEFNGTFWFGEGSDRSQRFTSVQSKNLKTFDSELKALRGQYDSALWVRAAFAGKNRLGAFVLTNSEIQYHDLLKQQVVSKSFDRYTYYPDSLMTNLYFPTVVEDHVNGKVPALFTTETSGLNRGVKMLVPIFAYDGSVVEVVSPARLRFKSEAGCRPMDTPVFDGQYYFDYYCGDKILRIKLTI